MNQENVFAIDSTTMSKVRTLDEQKFREGRFAVLKDMWLRRRIGET